MTVVIGLGTIGTGSDLSLATQGPAARAALSSAGTEQHGGRTAQQCSRRFLGSSAARSGSSGNPPEIPGR